MALINYLHILYTPGILDNPTWKWTLWDRSLITRKHILRSSNHLLVLRKKEQGALHVGKMQLKNGFIPHAQEHRRSGNH